MQAESKYTIQFYLVQMVCVQDTRTENIESYKCIVHETGTHSDKADAAVLVNLLQCVNLVLTNGTDDIVCVYLLVC